MKRDWTKLHAAWLILGAIVLAWWFASPQRRFRKAFDTPIAFYGRVIDQDGSGIEGAIVSISANDKAFGGRSSEYSRQTDANGRFSIDGIVGVGIGVEVSKAGYRVVPESPGRPSSRGYFRYSVPSAAVVGPHRSGEDNPTTFVLHRPGPVEPLVEIGRRQGGKVFRLARDGSPLLISLDGRGGHPVMLRCWNKEVERPAGQREYDWRLEIEVSNGGLLVRQNDFAFEAPEHPYNSKDVIEMPASLLSKWRDSIERSYFFRFDDGTYARADLRVRAYGDRFVVWHSFFNPKSGSRNLEAEPDSVGR